MADIKHKVERAAFGTAIDGILKYVNKDQGSGSADCVEAAAVHGLPCEPALQ